MRHQSHVDPTDAGTPLSVEAAFRRVRLLVGALLLVRLWTVASLPRIEVVALVAAFWSINIASYFAERGDARRRLLLGVFQIVADSVVVLLAVWAQHTRSGTESADWAILVLPAIEGAIRFRVPGAIASWLVLAGGYWGTNLASSPNLSAATVAQRLTVVLLVAVPVGYLSDQLVGEMNAHRRGRYQAEQRSTLLRIAALGGRRASRLDVDEVVDVIRATAEEMGFVDPVVFELDPEAGADPTALKARPVPGSFAEPGLEPGDERVMAAAAARATGRAFVRRSVPVESMLVALTIPSIDDGFIALTALWPAADEPPEAPVESLELFAAQAGASLHNARRHRGLEELKDRLDHEASHDSLTALANRRLFTDELHRAVARARPLDLVAVLFVDLDGFKDVNDQYGHAAGNDLLVEVAGRLRDCVRPGDLVARLGGDEFTIMLTRLDSAAPAAAIAERICTLVAEPVPLGSRTARVSVSVGIALTTAGRTGADDVLRRADRAMYRAKSAGKAQWAMDPDSLQAVGDADGPGQKNL